MKVVAIADLQSQQDLVLPEKIPFGDILLCAGDLTTWGNIEELEAVNRWLGRLPHTYKIIIAGNHDAKLEGNKKLGKQLFTHATYIENELVEINGVRIWGSPINERNNLYWHRKFADNQAELCELIPEGLDILLTHGPPFGILDQLIYTKESVGSKFILNAIQEKKPKYHIFGHIHESYSTKIIGETTFINAALCDPWNQIVDAAGDLIHPPIVFEI